jgi:hypothetical protein
VSQLGSSPTTTFAVADVSLLFRCRALARRSHPRWSGVMELSWEEVRALAKWMGGWKEAGNRLVSRGVDDRSEGEQEMGGGREGR